ncbi:stage V sporulation protein K [Mangrovibacillus cuniculi]|uniref:Stage V sporulation protein K n=1 Tax=Mangrovibacillus cuniculi TaxID=2593652 RepID=A0A7S8CAJ8_9BACI|nr:stage V sporulation protein K [Mangrovibacillus cuniculi]QPC46434.1 stage V sporulation protein K [Mangrovibacillus cuniculi]
MEQPFRMKNNGQISIVLGSEKRNKVKELPKHSDEVVKQHAVQHAALKEIEDELSTLVGMEEMKKLIKEVYAWIHVNKVRESAGLRSGKQALHMMFKGNPGTGKTTVARLIGKLFAKMNVLSKGHVVEVERADIVGEYIGHTAQKTRQVIKNAMGGILFIDEAYSLSRGGEKDFGKEAIDTLVKHMEDKQHEFILILAGYSREMDYFLSLNPGLQSRFPVVFQFPDYTIDQLMEISSRMLEDKEYRLSEDAEKKLKEHLYYTKSATGPTGFSNGRYVRNVIEKAIRAQSMRLLVENRFDRHELMTLRSRDFNLVTEEKRDL